VERVRVFVRSTFQSLQIRNYRLFATGQLISLIFGWVQITAQDWLVLELSHGSASALGVVTALQFAPMLLFTLYAGKLADRFDKRYLLIVANLLWFVLAALIRFVLGYGHGPLLDPLEPLTSGRRLVGVACLLLLVLMLPPALIRID